MNKTNNPKKRVLIAEDDPVSRRVLEVFLGKWGYDVVAVADGAQALRVLEAEDSPRLAVLDWMMPGMEGTEVCKRVRQHSDRPYIYILLLTARTQKDDLLKGLEFGADDYLTKPFDSKELCARLEVGQRIVDLQDALIKTREDLRFRATHDDLTDIANRAVILDALRREALRQAREGNSFAVILLDLDHFKCVNDTHGHLSGDAVLKEAARRMSTLVRAYDTVGRYGGEEFLIVVPAADAPGALGLAERIRKGMETPPISTPGGEIQITASLGVAVSTVQAPLDSQTLVRLADEALYRAKEQGRNRVELALLPVPDSCPPVAENASIKSGSR
jgi:two-component system, cell cycle response regulator